MSDKSADQSSPMCVICERKPPMFIPPGEIFRDDDVCSDCYQKLVDDTLTEDDYANP